MTPNANADSGPSASDEERLVQALISRGLVTADEVEACRAAPAAPAGTDAFLARLVDARVLTPGQARRVSQELALYVGQQIPGYQLLEKLGQGSMGIVFKARQLSMNRLVAIKILNPRLAANPKDLERFLHEAHLAAKLSHNNIVQGIDAGSAGKIHYFVMEYLEGTTIDQQLEEGKVYSEREALEIMLQIAGALEHANRRHMVHRDIKPGNIILTGEGCAKLADLGLARQTAGDARTQHDKGLIQGTPFYIAPEQIQGREDIDIRADIYSLGATLYHMVTGRPPFSGKKVAKIFEAHLQEELTPPDHLNTSLSAGLGEVVEFMMAKKRDRRYPSPHELIMDFECLLAGEPPKFARQKLEANTLQGLAEGEAEGDDGQGERAPRSSYQWLLVSVLGALLALSLVVNLILLLRR
jgi:serine/threonine-protein kinase